MTLDEAIKHCEEKAEELKKEASFMPDYSEDIEPCLECAKEHEQLAGWLKELKEFREMPEGDLISREALKADLRQYFTDGVLDGISAKLAFAQIIRDIDNAPTVKVYTEEELKKKYDEGLNDGYATCYDRYVRKNDEPFC